MQDIFSFEKIIEIVKVLVKTLDFVF